MLIYKTKNRFCSIGVRAAKIRRHRSLRGSPFPFEWWTYRVVFGMHKDDADRIHIPYVLFFPCFAVILLKARSPPAPIGLDIGSTLVES